MSTRAAIIIPTTGRNTLERAISSALHQDRPASEIIVVNDGRNAISVPPGVRILRTSGGHGPGAARALALSYLSPETNAATYLDDDDELLPCHVKLLSEKLEEGHKFAFSRATFRHADGRETEDPEPANKGVKRYYDPTALLSQNIAPVSCFMHAMGAYAAVGGWDESLARMEDWDLWGRMFIAHGPPGFVPSVTTVIHKDGGENRTDGNRYIYSLSCSWRDIVADRLRDMAAGGRAIVSEEDRRRARLPRVGVVMPVYMAEKYLAQSMESILGQTFADMEVLAINDCSTDGSVRILERFASLDKRVRIFHMPSNSGVSKALNMGLLVSRSELLARMDADDVSRPERLEKQVSFLDANRDISIVGTRFFSMTEDLRSMVWDNHDMPLSHEDIAMGLRMRCCIGHPTVMMRRSVIESIGGYSEAAAAEAAEDYDLWLRALSRGIKFANLPDPLLLHRTHEGQVSRRKSKTQAQNTAALAGIIRAGGM